MCAGLSLSSLASSFCSDLAQRSSGSNGALVPILVTAWGEGLPFGVVTGGV